MCETVTVLMCRMFLYWIRRKAVTYGSVGALHPLRRRTDLDMLMLVASLL